MGHEVKISMTYISWSSDFALYLAFMVQWFCLISWRLFDVYTSYFGSTNQYDPTFDLKINVGHCDLYFMVQWLCLIPRRLFHVWTSLFGIMYRYNPTHDLKIKVGHRDLYFMVKWFYVISWSLFDVWTSSFWPQNKCTSLWSILHGLLILPYISKTDGWVSYF